jgi:hypothetical protein
MLLQMADGAVVADSAAAVYQCQPDTLDMTTFQFHIHQSERSGCWPLAAVVYSAVRPENQYDQGECTNAPRALKFLQYLHSQTSSSADLAASLYNDDASDDLTQVLCSVLYLCGICPCVNSHIYLIVC